MNLRQSRIDDHWRRTFARTYETRFKEISFSALACLANATIPFQAGMSAIVGANGVGKSTLAGAIAELLANCSKVDLGHPDRLRGSTVTGSALVENVERTLAAKDDEAGGRVVAGEKFEGVFEWLDPSNLAIRCSHQINADQNFGDLLEPLTPLNLDQDDLEIASYLVGKQYDEILIYEIADYKDFEAFPYFQVSSCATRYGSESMGRGELSLLLMFWALRVLPKNSILLLEEPETHVSPRSQECLMNIVAKLCDDRGVSIIITTNSPSIIQRIPKENIVLLARDRGSAEIVKGPSATQVASILGGGAAFRGAMLVEDQAAKDFAHTIFEELHPDLLSRFDFAPAGSKDTISKLLEGMPKTGTWLTLVGVYDGDLRDEIDTADFNWPAVFLPGGDDPDKLLKSIIASTPNISDLLATELRKDAADVVVAINRIAGTDYHDIVSELSNSLNLPHAIIRRSLARIWLQRGDNREKAKVFMEELRMAIDHAHA
jgi:predicted ATPase